MAAIMQMQSLHIQIQSIIFMVIKYTSLINLRLDIICAHMLWQRNSGCFRVKCPKSQSLHSLDNSSLVFPEHSPVTGNISKGKRGNVTINIHGHVHFHFYF